MLFENGSKPMRDIRYPLVKIKSRLILEIVLKWWPSIALTIPDELWGRCGSGG